MGGMTGTIKEVLITTRGGTTYAEVKADTGGGELITAELFLSPGVDALPLPGDSAQFVPGRRTGGWVCLGVIDTAKAPAVVNGEAELYGRSSGGARVSSVRVKADGSVVINEGTDFAVQFTAMKAAFDQFISDYDGHGHGGMGASPPPPTSADMSGAKVATVKLP